MPGPIWSDASYPEEALVFPAVWVGTDMPQIQRECHATYDGYPLTSMAPKVIGPDDDFEFIREMDTPSEEEKREVQKIVRKAAKLSIQLPEDFTKFMSSKRARDTIRSCTAC